MAFCTKYEGNDGDCDIYLQSLDAVGSDITKITNSPGFIPRWWVDPSTKDTFLVFTSSSMLNDDSIEWSSTKTYRQKIDGNMLAGNKEVLVDNGSFHDGLSADGRFIVTGSSRLRIKDLQEGAIKTLFTSPANGKDAQGSIQVCNVSMSPGAQSNILFLDLGYFRISSIVGTPYGFHEYMFISDVNGSIQKWFQQPGGSEGWKDCEWSNQPSFIISGIGQTNAIYSLNIHNSNISQIVTGTNLREPALWIADSFSFNSSLDLDSLGHYNDPQSDQWQMELASKMPSFWRVCDSVNAFCVGSSQAQDGIDPREIKNVKMYNLAFGAGDLKSVVILVHNYILLHSPKVRLIIMSLDPGWLNYEEGSRTWNSGMANTKGFNYDKNHFFWSGGLPLNFKEYISVAPNPHTGFDVNDQAGHNANTSNGWATINCDPANNNWDTSSSNYKSNLELIRALGRDLSARNMVLLQLQWVPMLKARCQGL